MDSLLITHIGTLVTPLGTSATAANAIANSVAGVVNVPGNAIYMIYAEDAEGIIRNVKMRVR